MSNVITEEEARKCWCPYGAGVLPRYRLDDDRRTEPMLLDKTEARCIASECMAWRKRESAEFIVKADAAFRRDGVRLVSTEGFCGLAGAPGAPS